MTNLSINENCDRLEYMDKVIYANRSNGKWLRIPFEVSEILQQIIDIGISKFDQLEFEQDSDKKYIEDVINTLYSCGILVVEEEKAGHFEKTISIEITNKCNLKCKHCYVNAGEGNNPEFTTDQLIEIIDKAISWNPNNITLSGGEPMYRKDFFFLLDYLRLNFSGQITLSTNGLYINESNIKTICRSVNQIDISIDGVDEESCAIVRGKGVFNKVLQCIDLLKKNNFENISLSMVFSDMNEHLEKDFDALCKRLNVKALPRVYANMGRAKENQDLFTKKNIDQPMIPDTFIRNDPSIDIGYTSCQAGKNMIFVRYDGTVYPCPSYMKPKYVMGNILSDRSISELTHNMSDMVETSMYNANLSHSEKCSPCPVKDFCWTCPGDTDNFLTEAAIEKYCQNSKPILMERIWG